MKREIKFRAWDSEQGMMFNVPHDVANVMQYTGLKDKNGKEIYEGDIVQIDDELAIFFGIEAIAPITYRRGQFYANSHCENMAGLSVLTDMNGQIARCEIIGSIYENPDLLTNNK